VLPIALKDLPWFDYAPESFQLYKQHWRNYIKPGFFLNAGDTFTNYDLALRENRIGDLTPGIESKNTFPHTQINAMPAEFDPKWYEASDVEHGDISSEVHEAIKSHFIISGFTWTAGLGHYQGYWQDDDVTSPITTQLILFDGKKFTFGGYQLNTLAIDPENDYWNKSVNLCYVDESLDPTADQTALDQIARRFLQFAMNHPDSQFSSEGSQTSRDSVQMQSVMYPDISIQIPVKRSRKVEDEKRMEEVTTVEEENENLKM
jgi:hypothetical protein